MSQLQLLEQIKRNITHMANTVERTQAELFHTQLKLDNLEIQQQALEQQQGNSHSRSSINGSMFTTSTSKESSHNGSESTKDIEDLDITLCSHKLSSK